MFKLLKSILLTSFITFSLFAKSANVDPKFVIAGGGFVSNDSQFSDSISKQTVKHFRDVYIGISLFNRIAIYTNETFLNKSHDVNYLVMGKEYAISTQVYTTGIMYEFYQETAGNHEYGLGASLNRNRRYLNDDINSKLKYNSACIEALYKYKPIDGGVRLAMCPRLWTTEKDNVANVGYITVYKRF